MDTARCLEVGRKLESPNTTLRTVPTNSKVFLRGLLNIREKQILTSVIEIQKEIGGNHALFEDNLKSTIFVKSFKIQSNAWRSFLNSSLIISEKCVVTPNFLFGYQEHFLSHEAKQAHATREIYVVLKAMRRYKRATHVTLVVL